MNAYRNFVPVVLVSCLSACTSPRDPLEDAALQASRAGTLVSTTDQGRTTAAVEAGSRLAENFYFIAKYQASAEQRQIVQAAAPKAVAKVKAIAQKKPPKASSTGTVEKKPESKAPRYIAVRTKSDSRAKSATSVMLWDTQSQEVVGNNVYDLNAPPPNGTVIRFETFSAEYVAAGS